MYYYEVAIPVNIRKLFVYKTDNTVTKGCRVLVDFNRKLITGFVWSQVTKDKLDKSIRYKNILEIIDDAPQIPDDLLKIAHWMSEYYFCSLGIVIMAMLPTAIQLQTLEQVKIKDGVAIDTNTLSDGERSLLGFLNYSVWTDVNYLRTSLKKEPVYKHLEHLEELGLIESKHSTDAKVKSKYAHYITVFEEPHPMPSLTTRQAEVYALLQSFKQSIPLASISDTVSRSVLKALEQKNLINIKSMKVDEQETQSPPTKREKNLQLTEEQKNVIEEIKLALKNRTTQYQKPFLLYGVTGSGKTEVYINLIRECLAVSASAIVLVPEIALTPQMEEWFFNAFGDTIAILHSRKSDRERWESWKRIKKGECKIVIGARSAIFAPLSDIGIIIVDEEHETSYKQDKSPRYNARDIAVLRAKLTKSVIVLGSATPSLESLNNANTGKYKMLKMLNRPLHFSLPTVTTVDMKFEEPNTMISKILTEKIFERLNNKEQTLLLLNRRGYASYVLCMNCGNVKKCERCDISMIYHSESHQLMCHYCGHVETMLQKCQQCGSYVLAYGSAGTQQLEKQLKILFPTAVTMRMDADTTTKKNSYHIMFEMMKEGKVDILFGTQMIAKGFDFPKVTLVGVVTADNSLNIPDFRAAERTFQLLTQVAGRSGRGEFPGEVVIQTYNPNHYAITSAAKQDFDVFSSCELPLRKKTKYSPFFRLARVVYSHKDLNVLQKETSKLNVMIVSLCNKHQLEVTTYFKNPSYSNDKGSIMGPVPAPLQKINDMYRFHIIVKAPQINVLQNVIYNLTSQSNIGNNIKVDIDIDPLSLL